MSTQPDWYLKNKICEILEEIEILDYFEEDPDDKPEEDD